MTSIQKNILTVVCLSGFFFAALAAHGQASGIAPKAQVAPALAPAEAPIMGAPGDYSAGLSVSHNTFVFPNTLPESNLPLTAGAMFASVVTTGINPLLAVLVVFLIGAGYREHKKAARKS